MSEILIQLVLIQEDCPSKQHCQKLQVSYDNRAALNRNFDRLPVHCTHTQELQRTANLDEQQEDCVMSDISAGSHIKVKRWKGCYSHHGIADGNGNVIHFRWNPEKRAGVITINELSVFRNGDSIAVIPTRKPKITLTRAYSKIGETGYNLITNNCEHFAEWCKTGNKKSLQTRTAIGVLSVLSAFIIVSVLPGLLH